MDLNYGMTGEGDGDQYNFSMGTGMEMLDGRAQLTLGVESTKQDGINDCTSRDFCRVSRGIIQNGTVAATFVPPFTFIPATPFAPRNQNVTEPDKPQFNITEGLRYAVLPTSVIWPTDAGATGYYTFNAAGNDIEELYTTLTPEEVAYIQNEGVLGDTPYGTGHLTYHNIPMIPEQERQNIYTSFRYELERGITLDASLSYAESNNTAFQDSTRLSTSGFGIGLELDNAYVQLASPAMQAELNERISAVTPGTFNGCFSPPYLGGSFSGERPPDGFDCHNGINKDWSDQIDRINNTDTNVTNFSFGASGDLFEGGSWTWDANLGYGFTDTTQQVQDWQSSNRYNMALDAALETDGVTPVCRINHSVLGQARRDQWIYYIADGLDDEIADGSGPDPEFVPEATKIFNALAAGCAPLNPFGLAMTPEAREYAFPTIFEGTEITQETASLSFSGELAEGFGAGPLRMAAGVDYRDVDTQNRTADDPVLARDFFLNYGDNYSGLQTNTEGFVELDMPLVRDVIGADSLSVNAGFRRTKQEGRQTGTSDPATYTAYTENWKASMVWQPVDLVRLRITRSSDTRAPSARELYGRNSPSAGGGTFSELNNPFRVNDEATPVNELYETYESQVTGGNPQLSAETSTSETLGVVFTPGGALAGLQASVDYYETRVDGGIETIGGNTVLNRCFNEVSQGLPEQYCPLVEFGLPDADNISDPNDPRYNYTNVEVLRGAQENVSPYWNRGFDVSVSYNTQLDGGGQITARVLATRYLEQSVDLGGYFPRTNVAGQTGANVGGSFGSSFGVNYSPVPNISSNMWFTYGKNALQIGAQVRYIGTGRLNNQDGWIGPGEADECDPPSRAREGPGTARRALSGRRINASG
jgi:hypothetical protein